MAVIDLKQVEDMPGGSAIIVGDKNEVRYAICREGAIVKMFKVIKEF